MRFLIDAQLPPRLVAAFAEAGCEAQHVTKLGLSEAKDHEIWDFAERGGFAIVSKDEDFAFLSRVRGGRVALVWIRIGNSSADYLCRILAAHVRSILDALEQGERIVEVN